MDINIPKTTVNVMVTEILIFNESNKQFFLKFNSKIAQNVIDYILRFKEQQHINSIQSNQDTIKNKPNHLKSTNQIKEINIQLYRNLVYDPLIFNQFCRSIQSSNINKINWTYKVYQPTSQFLNIISHIKFSNLTELIINPQGSNIISIQPLIWLDAQNLTTIQINNHKIAHLRSLAKTNFKCLKKMFITYYYSYVCQFKKFERMNFNSEVQYIKFYYKNRRSQMIDINLLVKIKPQKLESIFSRSVDTPENDFKINKIKQKYTGVKFNTLYHFKNLFGL